MLAFTFIRDCDIDVSPTGLWVQEGRNHGFAQHGLCSTLSNCELNEWATGLFPVLFF